MEQEETRITILEDTYFELESRGIKSFNISQFLEVLVAIILADDDKMERVKYDSNEGKIKVINLVFKCLKFIMSPDLYNHKDVMAIYYLTNRLIVYAGNNTATESEIIKLKKLFDDFMNNYAEFVKEHINEQIYIAVLYRLVERKEGTISGKPVFKDETYTLNTLKNTIDIIEKYELEVEKKKEGCFIATMVYGGYNTEEVRFLRKFRDNVIKKYKLGNLFIRIYYYLSPKLIQLFGNNLTFRKLCKRMTDLLIQSLK